MLRVRREEDGSAGVELEELYVSRWHHSGHKQLAREPKPAVQGAREREQTDLNPLDNTERENKMSS